MTEQIDEVACDQLLKEMLEFLDTRSAQLGIDGGMAMNIATSAVAFSVVHMHLPKNAPRADFDAAMRELMPRIYDAAFSIKDWIERKTPWRMQSKFMRETPGVVGRIGKKGMDS